MAQPHASSHLAWLRFIRLNICGWAAGGCEKLLLYGCSAVAAYAFDNILYATSCLPGLCMAFCFPLLTNLLFPRARLFILSFWRAAHLSNLLLLWQLLMPSMLLGRAERACGIWLLTHLSGRRLVYSSAYHARSNWARRAQHRCAPSRSLRGLLSGGYLAATLLPYLRDLSLEERRFGRSLVAFIRHFPFYDVCMPASERAGRFCACVLAGIPAAFQQQT